MMCDTCERHTEWQNDKYREPPLEAQIMFWIVLIFVHVMEWLHRGFRRGDNT